LEFAAGGNLNGEGGMMCQEIRGWHQTTADRGAGGGSAPPAAGASHFPPRSGSHGGAWRDFLETEGVCMTTTNPPLPDGESIKAMLAKPRLFDAEQIRAFLTSLERGNADRWSRWGTYLGRENHD